MFKTLKDKTESLQKSTSTYKEAQIETSEHRSRKEKAQKKEQTKIYCANCTHCRVIKVATGESEYVLRIRCAHKQWRKKLGEEKIYKFFTVSRRTMNECKFYDAMGSAKEYLKELKKTLPVRDEVYKG